MKPNPVIQTAFSPGQIHPGFFSGIFIDCYKLATPFFGTGNNHGKIKIYPD